MKEALKLRIKKFALANIEVGQNLPKTSSGNIIANQIMRSGNAVTANYRAVCSVRNDKEFISKLNIVLKKADEVCFWFASIEDKKWKEISLILNEANKLTAIFAPTLKTINSQVTKNKYSS